MANHIWQSTLCAFAAWLLTRALARNRAAVRYRIWLAASIKFLIPFSLLVSAGSQLGWRSAPPDGPRDFSFALQRMGRPFGPPASTPSHATAQAADVVPAALFAAWVGGFVVIVASWWRWWRRIREIRRSATPLPIDAPIRVMSSSAQLEPAVTGILKPVLLLPQGILEYLPPGQSEAIVAHELCHVRRRDNLTGAIHMIVEAVYWFHPLLWWIGARLIEERERACDQEVLRMSWEPRIYAEGILNVCRFCIKSPLACLSGVTGSDLKKRIEAIMANRMTNKLMLRHKIMLVLAASAAVVVPLFIGAANAPLGRAQSHSGRNPDAFEVASIKPSTLWKTGGEGRWRSRIEYSPDSFRCRTSI